MALCREQIEHFEHEWIENSDQPWRKKSDSNKWRKRQYNKYLRIKNKEIDEDETGFKRGKKHFKGYQY